MSSFIFSFFIALVNPVCSQPLDISGTVTDRDSRLPIQGVHVFITGSQKGIDTNADGKFHITDIEQETFQLIFSHVGYQTRTISFDAGRSSKRLDVSLKAEQTLLDEVVVSAKKDRKWNRDLKKFKKFFFGEGYQEGLITIDNDYEIEFADKRGRDLIVNNKPALSIKNDFLGYEVFFQLVRFELSDVKTYLGYSNFKAMEPANPEQGNLWKSNRLEAYQGSTRHFFKSLLNGTLDTEAFSATLKPEVVKDNMATGMLEQKEEIRYEDQGIYKQNIFIKPISEKVFEVTFDGIMEIVYYEETDQYGDPQSSEIILTGPLTVHTNGVVMNPAALTANGFWTHEGMFQALPFEYKPGS